nr:phosphodiester glycosidase family protein [Crinalium epipsammum]
MIFKTKTSCGQVRIKSLSYLKKLSLNYFSLTLLFLASAQVGQTQQVSENLSSNVALSSSITSNSPTLNPQQLAATLPQLVKQGTQISLNGRTLPIAWSQWKSGKSTRTGISDTGLMQATGVELLNTNNSNKQPVVWFSKSQKPLSLDAKLVGSYRYLDITNFSKTAGWQLQIENNILKISSPSASIKNIQQESQPLQTKDGISISPQRIIVELDKPTPWQVSQNRNEGIITIEGIAEPELIQRYTPPVVTPPTQNPTLPDEGSGNNLNLNPVPVLPFPPTSIPVPTPQPQDTSQIKLESSQNQTTIKVNVPTGWRLRASTISNPNRLVIDIAPDALVERNILWSPGVRWQQKLVNLGADRFPIVWLEVDPKQRGLTLKPIWSNSNTLVGTAPLLKIAPLSQASAAVNAGFFNRKQLVPLGAIRQDNRWVSSPILNRGAIAWNNNGNIKIGRLTLDETITTSTGENLPIFGLNSGYVQAGIARYTPTWGTTYTPLTDNEILVVVQNNQVANLVMGGKSGQTPFPIPSDGYLLTIRAKPELADVFTVDKVLRINSSTNPVEFSQYSNVVGAGPVLIQNRQIVLDAKAEKFSDAFIAEAAIRTAIATTPSGKIIIAAVHNRAGGAGPTLAEFAQLMQQMGVVDALNLDGGSSTSLYLGGQLINRSPATAARVHNGIGIFLNTP